MKWRSNIDTYLKRVFYWCKKDSEIYMNNTTECFFELLVEKAGKSRYKNKDIKHDKKSGTAI